MPVLRRDETSKAGVADPYDVGGMRGNFLGIAHSTM